MHCHRLHHVMNAMADAPMGIMPHGGMFTLMHVIPTDPDAEWNHPSQQAKDRCHDANECLCDSLPYCFSKGVLA